MKLAGKLALVTGGGSGIGRAIAVLFANEGADVVVAGRRREPLDETLTLLPKGGKSCAITADVSQSASVRSLFEEITRRFGRLDILVNNAGSPAVDDMDRFNKTVEARGREFAGGGAMETQWRITEDMSDELWRSTIAAHLDSTFYCTRAGLKLMSQNGGGAIINVASTAGLTGQEGAPHYSAAKAGMLGFTRALAREVASQNVRVNALCPGFVETPMSEGYSPGFRRGTLGRIPLGRWGTAEEVAAVALFLASDDASYFTGQSLSPNGGIFIS
jgi:3-oxoacyl-[acyl-carrier protein] reductase